VLEENNPRDLMDVFLQQMEAENADENSIFTGSYIIFITWAHTLWHNCSTSGAASHVSGQEVPHIVWNPKLTAVFTMGQWVLH
jgi:hypothetical protein